MKRTSAQREQSTGMERGERESFWHSCWTKMGAEKESSLLTWAYACTLLALQSDKHHRHGGIFIHRKSHKRREMGTTWHRWGCMLLAAASGATRAWRRVFWGTLTNSWNNNKSKNSGFFYRFFARIWLVLQILCSARTHTHTHTLK